MTEKETLLLDLAETHIADFKNEMVDHWSEDNRQTRIHLSAQIKELTDEYKKRYGENPEVNWRFEKDNPKSHLNIDKIYETANTLRQKR